MPSVRKFNPGVLQRDEDLAAQFVVRNHEFRLLVEVLRGNVGAESCQHLAVVGRRGMGKTMLLARLCGELRTDAVLSRRLLPVRFSEESHEILDMADFWSEALFHLAREAESRDPGISRELHAVHAELTKRWRGEDLEHRARATVLDAADRLGRQLVLMVENLQTLMAEASDDFGWRLRAVLQTEPQIMLVATATARFGGLDDPSAPFFDLFRSIGLERLGTKDCRRLWERVSGRRIAERRVRPLEILTGGNPRLLVIVAGFGRRRSLRDLMEQLVALIDEHTEYFRNYLEGIAKTERRVYLAVIDLWQPSTSQEIADRARLDIRNTSALLGRLTDRGAVEVEPVGKKRRYLAAERLYAIYYKLRRERDDATVVRQLVRFMEAFFTEEEFSDFVRSFRGEARESADAGRWIEAATGESSFAEVWEAQSMKDLQEAYERGDWKSALSQADQVVRLPEVDDTGTLGVMAKIYGISALIHLDRPREALERCEEHERTGAVDSEEARFLSAMVLGHKGDALRALDREEEALSCFEDAIRRLEAIGTAEGSLLLAKFRFECGGILVALGRSGEAVRAAEGAIADAENLEDPVGRSLWAEALVLRAKAGFELAVEERRPLDGEIAACQRVIERFGDDSSPEVQWPVTEAVLKKANLLAFGGQPRPALEALRGIESRFGDDAGESRSAPERMADAIRADALFQSGSVEEALEIVRRLYSEIEFDDTPEKVRLLTAEFVRFVVAGAKEGDLLEVLDRDRRKAEAVAPLTVALKRRAGQVVRTPREVLQVADDLVEFIELAMVQDRRYRERVRGDGERRGEPPANPATNPATNPAMGPVPGTPYSP